MARGQSARDRLREHFLLHVGRVMDGDELRPIAKGISEWARRIRELRDEEGLQIRKFPLQTAELLKEK